MGSTRLEYSIEPSRLVDCSDSSNYSVSASHHIIERRFSRIQYGMRTRVCRDCARVERAHESRCSVRIVRRAEVRPATARSSGLRTDVRAVLCGEQVTRNRANARRRHLLLLLWARSRADADRPARRPASRHREKGHRCRERQRSSNVLVAVVICDAAE